MQPQPGRTISYKETDTLRLHKAAFTKTRIDEQEQPKPVNNAPRIKVYKKRHELLAVNVTWPAS
ncbi:hypothetical protein N7524_011147 [Penicillium chrysogenum]|nr:hypothetical protein N7524_011147 [Penicillium chrysogenum]